MTQNTNTSQLIDGSSPATPRDVEKKLESLGIAYKTISHSPMYTVDDSRKFRDGVPGGYSKNLFLRNKKGLMWLVTLNESTQIDLKELGQKIGAGRVSFGSTTRLMNFLGVVPGAVTPLAVINDITGVVKPVIESGLLQLDPLHFHPCDNSMTTTLDSSGLLSYMKQCNHEPMLLDLSGEIE